MHIVRADHIVLTVRDLPATIEWYHSVLGMTPLVFGDGRHALAFGSQKLNLHEAGREWPPHAAHPVPGSVDLCLISAVSLSDVQQHLRAVNVDVELGPVTRTGATGLITSIYLRDPDGNLVEVSTYDQGRPQAPDPYDLLPPVPTMALASDDISDGKPLADRHLHSGLGGANHSPALAWSGAPARTRGYAVTCYDPDAPTGSGFWHWLLVGLPAGCTGLATDAGRGDGEQLPPGTFHLRNDFGEPAYAGAFPPAGDPTHRYFFAVHALDTDDLGLTADASAGYAGFTITAHTLGRGVLRPTCRPE
jgi:Raf kinase inhibitor-like YbhB/YbcL family protein